MATQLGFKTFNDISGQTCNYFEVIKRVPPPEHCKDKVSAYFLCKCICGELRIIRGCILSSGRVKSCGCINKLASVEAAQDSTYMKIFKGKGKYNDRDLLFQEYKVLAQQNCFYCGIPPFNRTNKHTTNPKSSKFAIENGWVVVNGLDRIRSGEGHFKINVVPCCKFCNLFKLQRSYDDTISHILSFQDNFIINKFENIQFITDLIVSHNLDINDDGVLRKLYPIKSSEKRRDYLLSSVISKWKSRDERIDVKDNFSNLLLAQFMLSNCSYCGIGVDPSNRILNQIDRIDNNIGYELSNCVVSCHFCNSGKGTSSLSDFNSWFLRIKANVKNLPQSENELNVILANRKII